MENYSEEFCESDQKLKFAFFKFRHIYDFLIYGLVHASTCFSEAVSTGKLDYSLGNNYVLKCLVISDLIDTICQ